jgi:hemerythrin superfamily protein
MSSLAPFMLLHDALLEKFRRHRDLLIEGDLRGSGRELAAFEKDLRAHMGDEERRILPLYAKRVAPAPGGSPEMFRLEHRNLLKNLAGIRKAFRALRRPGSREIQRFLEAEHLFLQILDHHDRRERNLLYPRLEAATGAAERSALLKAAGIPGRRSGRARARA